MAKDMDARTWIAGMAMQAYIASEPGMNDKKLSEWSANTADALLAHLAATAPKPETPATAAPEKKPEPEYPRLFDYGNAGVRVFKSPDDAGVFYDANGRCVPSACLVDACIWFGDTELTGNNRRAMLRKLGLDDTGAPIVVPQEVKATANDPDAGAEWGKAVEEAKKALSDSVKAGNRCIDCPACRPVRPCGHGCRHKRPAARRPPAG
jgi:hypothetical protein